MNETSVAHRHDADGDAPVFMVAGVTKVYQKGEVAIEVIRSVDLSMRARELAGLLGPSGSGKSTLLNIIGGLDVPTSGRVPHREHDLASAGDAGTHRISARARRVRLSVLQPYSYTHSTANTSRLSWTSPLQRSLPRMR